MYERGVELHTGTDTLIAFVVPGASLHRELRLFVDAGFTPEQALRALDRTTRPRSSACRASASSPPARPPSS